jgi:hypothetical protein
MDNNLCKGCNSAIWIPSICSNTPISNGKECPCVSCLVKGMCVEPCGEFVRYGGDDIDEN